MYRILTRSTWPVILLVIGLALTAVPAAYAQGEDTTLINIGENKIGEVTAERPTAAYLLTVFDPQPVDIQVLAVTEGFAPALRVFDPSGAVVQEVTNTGAASVAQVKSLDVIAGVYRIEVGSANGQPGQYVLGIQAGEPLPPPVPLVLGGALEGSASSDAPRQRYAFAGLETDALLLYVTSEQPEFAPLISLKDAGTEDVLASTSARVTGVRYRIPAGVADYLVEVANSGASASEPYTVCLENASGTGPRCPADAAATPVPTATAVVFVPSPTAVPQAQPLPPLPSTGACVVASLTGGAVNVRSGPSTSFPVLFQLSGNALAAVTGRLADGWAARPTAWWWISTSAIRIGGQCGSVSVVVITPTSPATSTTPTASPTVDLTMTATPTLDLTMTATWTPTATEPWTATPTVTNTPAMVATLNFSLPPVYGLTALTSGFVPIDTRLASRAAARRTCRTWAVGVRGSTSSAPSFSVNYTAGAFPTLRFYFIGTSDSTMIINTPGGSYVCVDDLFGTLNPTIDFNSPASGRYDIWIASFRRMGDSFGHALRHGKHGEPSVGRRGGGAIPGAAARFYATASAGGLIENLVKVRLWDISLKLQIRRILRIHV